MTSTENRHIWKFNRIGGLDQVRLTSGSDLLHLRELDPKLWVALSCPTKGLELDQRTLDYIDTDHDGHIRVPELVAAVAWAGAQLKDAGELLKPAAALPLASIHDGTDTGKTLLKSARQILRNLGKPDATVIGLGDTSDGPRIFHDTRFNGDGIVTPFSAEDPALKKVIEEILLVQGSEIDRTGKPGINQARADAFFAALTAYSDWCSAEENCLPPEAGSKYFAAGGPAAAGEAFQAYHAVSTKVDDYFLRCRMAAFDPKAAVELNPPVGAFLAITAKNLVEAGAELRQLPLQTIAPGRPLQWSIGLNPAWSEAIGKLARAVVIPVLGADTTELTEESWQKIAGLFAGYSAWWAKKPMNGAEQLGVERVRAILAGNFKNKIDELIAEDMKLAGEANNIEAVDRLVRYYLFLHKLLRNFANFEAFYDSTTPAIFQLGTMFLDQRSFRLCVRVEDPVAHSAMAALSKAYIIYCACSRAGGEKLNLAVAVTQGENDYVTVGRNGVFVDFQGRDWDATVVKVVENPISVRQAFWSPYRRLARLIEEQIHKFASSKDKEVLDQASQTTTSTVAGAPAAAAPPKPGAPGSAAAKPPFDIARFAGIFAAIGLAIGAMLGAFFTLEWWQMPLALIGILLVVSGPSMIMAWFNLRKRILGPVLEGNGWAINGRVRINIPLGNSMTRLATLPPNAKSSLHDPFEDLAAKRQSILYTTFAIVLVLALLYFFILKPKFIDDP
ncbi:MAG TPA: hypothetical protein VL860_10980, partial [Planctomycetota bacterium]|nr:hypothetical protein [Planctomycetota bacterium]